MRPISPKMPAQDRRREVLLQLLPDGTFGKWTSGDLATVDRFLSNFHKPLQRRMLHIDPTVDIPATGVIKVKSTGQIYLISEPRDDAQDNKAYDRLCVLHIVSGAAGGLVDYYNYEVNDTNPPATQARLDKVLVGKVYLSVEFMSSREAEQSDEAYEAKFVVYSPNGTPLKENGVFTLNGEDYKIIQTYTDSSFSAAQVLKQSDDMQVLKYFGLGAGSGYNATTGAMTLNEVEYEFSGSVDVNNFVGMAKAYTVYSKAPALPFTFEPGRRIELPDGKQARIISTTKDTNARGHIKVVCEGS